MDADRAEPLPQPESQKRRDTKRPTREERKAQALRDNLRRRKEQVRARQGDPEEPKPS